MDLDKIEMFVNTQCQGSVRALMVDGQPRGATFSRSSWATTSDLPAQLQPPYQPLLFRVSLGL